MSPSSAVQTPPRRPVVDEPAPRSFASRSVAVHLARGAIAVAAFVGAAIGSTVVGAWALLLAPVGLVALRGCPTCWIVGLLETLSNRRLARECEGGRCTIRRAPGPE
jgi:hypothetical protein